MDKSVLENKFKEIKEYIEKIPSRKHFNIKKEAAKADCLEVVDIPSPTYSDIQYISSRVDDLRQQVWNLWDELYAHKNNGHIPPIVGAAAMTKALKALGLADDYDVQPKVIYASDGSKSKVVFEIPVQS